MKGYIDNQKLARIEIRVIGKNTSKDINAIVDTGFNGDIVLPTTIATQLGIMLCGTSDVTFADGSQDEELIFIGRISINGREREVEIGLTSSEDALIGAGILWGKTLTIKYRKPLKGAVEIG